MIDQEERDAAQFIAFVARVCHEANRAICTAIGDVVPPPWAEAGSEQHESMIKGVIYALRHPSVSPASQHAAWCADKIESGWTYGLVKDVDYKTHPNLVDYEDLPQTQKIKDHVFRAIVANVTTL